MVAKQELHALAGALKATQEYAAVQRQRRLILGGPMGPMMQSFEREHKRLTALELQKKEAEERFKRLYTIYGSYLAHPMVKEYFRAVQAYERIISDSVDYLHSIAGTGIPVLRR